MTEQERKLREQAFLDHSKGWQASLLKNAREDFEAGWAARSKVKNCLIADVVISEERAEFCSCNNLGYWQMADGKKYCNDSDCRLPKQN